MILGLGISWLKCISSIWVFKSYLPISLFLVSLLRHIFNLALEAHTVAENDIRGRMYALFITDTIFNGTGGYIINENLKALLHTVSQCHFQFNLCSKITDTPVAKTWNILNKDIPRWEPTYLQYNSPWINHSYSILNIDVFLKCILAIVFGVFNLLLKR